MERVRKMMVLWLALIVVPALPLFGGHWLPSEERTANVSLYKENGKVGLKDQSGNVLIPAEYDALGWSDSELAVVDEVVGYRANGLWGLINTSNKIVTPAEYAGLNPGEGTYLIARKTSLSFRPAFGVITTSGRKAIPLIYDGLTLSHMRAIVMARSGTEFKFGLSDLNHRLVIPIEYRRISPLGSLRYAVENDARKTAIFSEDGRQLTPFDIDSLSAFQNNYAVIYRGHHQGVIDRQGRVIVQPMYGEVRIDDGDVSVRKTHTYRVLTGANDLVREFDADQLISLSPEHYAVVNGGKVQLAASDLTLLHDGYFSYISEFLNGRAVFVRNGTTGLISRDGRISVPNEFDTLSAEAGAIRARKAGSDNRWTLLSADGKPTTERVYERIAPWNGKFFPVVTRGYWGGIDNHGNPLFSCVYDSLLQVSNTFIVVKFRKAYGVIDLGGDWIITPQPHRLHVLDDDLYFERSDSTTFLKSISGRLIYFTDNVLTYEAGTIREELPSGAHWIISRNGVIVGRSEHPDGTEHIFQESEGYRAIRKDGKYGFIDSLGRLRIANRYEGVQPFSDGMAAIRILGHWGFIDRHEKLAVQPTYDHVRPFVNGVAIVSRRGKWGAVDKQGKLVLPLRYDSIARTDTQRLLLMQGSLYGLADADGSIITSPRYDIIRETPSNYVVVGRYDKFGAITLSGVSTIPMIYDELTYNAYRDEFLALKRSEWVASLRSQ